ncbi:MAG: endonuclease [Oligoflexales bacterium]
MHNPKTMTAALFAMILGIVVYVRVLEPNLIKFTGQNDKPKTLNNSQAGNKTIKSFYQAKKKAHELYKGMETTFYCGCSFKDKVVNHHSCGFKPIQEDERSYRVEWEHVVPAYDFGRSFVSWRKGHPDCINSKGKKYKGRKCARKASSKFKLMESDLYNLVPAIGEVNMRRSNLPMGILTGESLSFGNCNTRIGAGMIEPRDQVKGFIARTYQYMQHAYPGHGIISRKNTKLFEAWDRSYPPSSQEIKRAKRIFIIQGNSNPILSRKYSFKSTVKQNADDV